MTAVTLIQYKFNAILIPAIIFENSIAKLISGQVENVGIFNYFIIF